jgi:hypothetical protein
LCFFLALLFLYNPFVAAPPSGTLNIQQNPSYRATIASSELQTFSPTDGSRIFAFALILFFAWLLFSSAPSLGRLEQSNRSSASVCRLMFASLWFRPPPSF